jgi:hypothetical protein
VYERALSAKRCVILLSTDYSPLTRPSVAGIGELAEDEFEIDDDECDEVDRHVDDTIAALPSVDERRLRQTSPEDIRIASGCGLGDDNERRRHDNGSPASGAPAGTAQLGNAGDQPASTGNSNGGCGSCIGAGATAIGEDEYSANGGELAQQVAVSGETVLRTPFRLFPA